MKLKLLLLAGVASLAIVGAKAQPWVYDTLVMGPGYAEDVYYQISSGNKHNVSNANWDLAFSAITTMSNPHYGVGVWVNEATNAATSRVELYSIHKSASAEFLTLSGADTVGATMTQLHNSSTTYAHGAFNDNSSGDIMDYGWGFYQGSPSHTIEGDSIYIAIKDEVAYKIWIRKCTSMPPVTWEFYVGLLDNSQPIDTVKINITADYADRTFAYYSLSTKQVFDREPNIDNWDFNLTRYMALISMGPGAPVPYPTTGVLSNPFVEVVEVRDVDADIVNYMNYISLFESDIDIIGRDWKKSTFSGNEYDMDTVTYFVRSRDLSIHQIEFTYSTLSSSGITALRKRTVSTNSVKDATVPVQTWALAPNPASDQVNVVLDAKANSEAYILVTDITGKIIKNLAINVKPGMNAFRFQTGDMPSGMYIVTVSNGQWKLSNKLVVQH
jgi:hypothetical protein